MRFSAPCLLAALLIAVPGALAPRAACAQRSLDDVIQQASEEYGVRYAQPLVDAVGANLNSGFFHKARVGGGLLPGVDVYLGVKAFGTLIPDEDRSLSLRREGISTEATFNGQTCRSDDVSYEINEAPTVFGERTRGIATISGTFTCENGSSENVSERIELLPGAVNTPIAPLAVPQAGVGIPLLGTHLTVRYLPRIPYGDLGSVQFAGAGLRHEVSSYIPLLPFAFSVHGFYQSLSIADGGENEVANASAYAAGVSASKSLLLFTVYGGLQVERATTEVNYTFDPGGGFDPQPLSFSLTGENTFRALAGVTFGLGPLAVNVDFSQGQRSVLSAGLGLSL